MRVRLLVVLAVFGLAGPVVGPGATAQVPLPLLQPTRIATVTQPTSLTPRPGDTALYVTEKTGRLRAIRGGVLDPVPALDLTSVVTTSGERGLLGAAFNADGSRLYVDFTDSGGDIRIAEFAFSGGVAMPGSRRDLLVIEHSTFDNHNGGHIAFGPDGYLYIAVGDGGGAGDPFGSGQRLDTLLGKILRIGTAPSGLLQYTIPADNPFVGVVGARAEIWAYGLRNPWKFSFDRLTGDLWIGDVGQSTWEEIDFQPAASDGGENYGWNRMEGRHRFSGSEPANHTPPVYEYAHGPGICSVTGGYRYRGTRSVGLQGIYVFGDFCQGVVEGLVVVAGVAVPLVLGARVDLLTSFGQDSSGELYATSFNGGVFRLDPVLP